MTHPRSHIIRSINSLISNSRHVKRIHAEYRDRPITVVCREQKPYKMKTPKPIHPSIHPSIYLSMALQAVFGPWPLLQFLNLYIVGRTLWTGYQPAARPLLTHRTTQTQNKRTHTSMSPVGCEPTIPAFERAKTVHALDHAATVTGTHLYSLQKKTYKFSWKYLEMQHVSL
jgi:hypothetical protein